MGESYHPSPIVRPPENDAEREAFFALSATQFIGDAPRAVAQGDFRRFVCEAPAADSGAVRGAFRGADYLGGYLIEERLLRVGPARLRAGCVGVVVVDPAQRGQGIGKALMHDAFAHARARGMVLLLLHGLADYYRPFGYADVFDVTEHAVSRAAILASAGSPYRVREATEDDASALLDLYDRHYGPHPGSFARSHERQEFMIRFAAALERRAYPLRDGAPFAPAMVAVGADDQPRGYVIAPWGPLRAFGNEVAADDWPATLALLQHDAAKPGDREAIRWPLPPDSLAAALLADHFVVDHVSTSRPWTNWEAALVDPLALMRGMLPAWNERWLRSVDGWRGTLALEIEGVAGLLHLGPAGITFEAGNAREGCAVSLTGPVVMPMIFGFRSVAWATLQKGQRIPSEMMPILEILFPPVTPWIPPTEGC
jgi:predicted N-acetyltransferase YhbS